MIRWLVRNAGAVAVAVAVATLATVGVAVAQPGREGDAADIAFFRGRALMEQGDRAAACAAFRESEALRPAAGTELNLAACLEADGHLVDAAAMLEQARARAQGRAEASRFAKAVRDLAGPRHDDHRGGARWSASTASRSPTSTRRSRSIPARTASRWSGTTARRATRW